MDNIQLKGRIERIFVPKNNKGKATDGSFAVFSFKIQEVMEGALPSLYDGMELEWINISCVGVVPDINLEDVYIIGGEFVEHPSYGRQFQIHYMYVDYQLESREDQYNFCRCVLTQHETDLLFQTSDNPIEILEKGDITTLCTIKGVGKSKAERLITKYNQNKTNKVAYAKLAKFELTKDAINTICQEFHSPEAAVDAVLTNPYCLIQYVKGFGWVKCDRIARAMGWSVNAPERLKAWTIYFLRHIADTEGHTWITVDSLMDSIMDQAPTLTGEECVTIIQGMIKDQTLYYDGDESRKISLSYYKYLEDQIAEELIRLSTAPCTKWAGVEQSIAEAEMSSGFTYTAEQRRAIDTILSNPVTVLTARAGCGKSSTMLPIANIARNNHKTIEMCALSGKASLNLHDITGVEGRTIHKLLGYTGEAGTMLHTQDNPINVDLLILDELSMVGGELFLKLLRATPTGATVVLIGDPGQLESIGLCNLLKDIVNSGVIPVARLTKILRQAMKSGILADSSAIYEGQQIVPSTFAGECVHGELQDFKIISCEDTQSTAILGLEEYKRIRKVAAVEDIIVLVAKRSAGYASARAMNEYIQRDTNPSIEGVPIDYEDGKLHYTITYKVNDRILVTANMYHIETVDGDTTDVFNGNIGSITEVNTIEDYVVAKFPQGTFQFQKTQLLKCQLGYAITTHKAQGSGIPYVIGLVDPSAYTLLTREFIYTMLTRAKKYCTMIGPVKTLRKAISTSFVSYKQTWLPALLNEKINLLQKDEEIC